MFWEFVLKHSSCAWESFWIYSESAMVSTWTYPYCAWEFIWIYPEMRKCWRIHLKYMYQYLDWAWSVHNLLKYPNYEVIKTFWSHCLHLGPMLCVSKHCVNNTPMKLILTWNVVHESSIMLYKVKYFSSPPLIVHVNQVHLVIWGDIDGSINFARCKR